MENRFVIPRRGWVPVKTRNQKELSSKKDLLTAQEDEINYFKQIVPKIADSCGTTYLKKLLNNDMQEIIVSSLPNVMRALQHEMDRSDSLVEQMKFYSSNTDKRDIIIKICRNISEDINTSIGLYQRTAELEKTTIGVVINKHMNDGFNSQINNIKEQKAYLRNSIIMAVKNSIGLTGFIEIPDKAIASIIRQSNSKFQEVVLNVLKQLCECVKECIIGTLESIEHYATMHRIFKAHLEEYVDITNFETQAWVKLFFEIDSSHTYFGDLSFMEENWESVTSSTNIEVHKTIFKTDVNILNIKIKPEFAYDYILILDEIQVETELEYNKWRGIFVSKGILCDEIRLIYNNLDHKGISHEDMVKYEKICMVLEKYLTVNRKKIQDLMTKILMKSLIYGFEKFCTYKLSSVMLQYDTDELFEITDDNKQEMDVKLEENQRLKSCYKELFKYMDKYAIKIKQDLMETIDGQSIEEEEGESDASVTNRPGSGEEGEEVFQNVNKRPMDKIKDFFNNIFSIFQDNKVDMEDIQFYDI
ncbi:hypothetical protein MXB_5703 [Myxobolus squamalis]|nr:hypothetical protein MXB_5703 [Myxobolus squamalis]